MCRHVLESSTNDDLLVTSGSSRTIRLQGVPNAVCESGRDKLVNTLLIPECLWKNTLLA